MTSSNTTILKTTVFIINLSKTVQSINLTNIQKKLQFLGNTFVLVSKCFKNKFQIQITPIRGHAKELYMGWYSIHHIKSTLYY